MLVQSCNKKKKDRELCVALEYKKMSKYNGSLHREGHSV